jgi:serine/threonine-protein kinase
VLPFTGLNAPRGVAVDGVGNLYVADLNNRVLKLPAGSTSQVELPFTGLNHPFDVAVDSAGVYVVDIDDSGNNRVLKLPAGSTSQVELPFTGLNWASDVAVDSAGNVYVTDGHNDRVLKLPTQ